MKNAHTTGVLKSAFLVISMRWLDRLLGFISTLVLARLLVPEDFGIIAMASLVVGLVDVLLDLGVNVALIQNHAPDREHYDTAWTLRLLQTTITALLVIIGAPFAGDFFGDPRVVPVIQIMGLGLILAGLENIGVVDFQKKMQFGLDFRFMFLKRFAGFVVTLIAAWLMRSYWALVIGALTGRSFGILLSYIMHPMRPRFGLKRFKDVFSVSQWMLLRNIAMYAHRNLHKFLVGNRADTETMGSYSLADQISSMPTTELLSPLNRILFPSFVKAKKNPQELKRMYLTAQGVQSLVGVPAGVGLLAVAHEAVLVLLGEKWMPAVPFVEWLALSHAISAMVTSAGYLMITLDKVKYTVMLTFINVFVFAFGALVAIPTADALELAIIRVATVAFGMFLSLALIKRAFSIIGYLDMLQAFYRPVLASLIMALAIFTLPLPADLNTVAVLLIKVITGAFTYCAVLAMLWWLTGRPEGGERYILDKIQTAVANRKSS